MVIGKQILNKVGHVIKVLLTITNKRNTLKIFYSRVCGNRKTEILNKVGHVIQMLVTQLRIKEIHRKVHTAECVVIGKQRF